MAGLSGKAAWIGISKQTNGNKLLGTGGTAPTTPQYKLPFSGGTLGPVRETDRLSETDTSRDQSAAYVTTSGVEGAPEVYVRDDSIGMILYATMGVEAVSGTTNYTHTITPAASLPYMALWRNVGGSGGVYEQYLDCMISSATFSADAGSPLTCAIGVQGLQTIPVTVGATKTSLDAVALNQGTVYNYNNGAVTLSGASTRGISSFELTIENNVTRQQTDDVTPWDVVPGTREISLGFDMLFESRDEYEKFHTGAIGGTSISPNIYVTSAVFTFTLGANNEISFNLPSIAYEEFPVDPDPGGDPIVVPVRAVAQKATGTPNLLTVTLKNQVASY